MNTRKTTADKIEAAKLLRQQADNEVKRLLQVERAEERKKRNHRICKRGGLLEKLLPDIIPLSDEQFQVFLEKVMLSESARRTLDGITAQVAEPTTPPAVEVTPTIEEESEVVTF